MADVGDKAPAFKLQDDAENTVSLKDFKGKWVVLYFYPKDMTPGCTTQACDFRDQQKLFAKKDAVVLGVSPDPVKRHGKFRDKHELNFPLLADPDREAIEAYGVWVKKKLYGREYMGVDRSTFLINPKGKIEKVWRKVKVKGHVDDVLSSI